MSHARTDTRVVPLALMLVYLAFLIDCPRLSVRAWRLPVHLPVSVPALCLSDWPESRLPPIRGVCTPNWCMCFPIRPCSGPPFPVIRLLILCFPLPSVGLWTAHSLSVLGKVLVSSPLSYDKTSDRRVWISHPSACAPLHVHHLAWQPPDPA